jgi:hypothetical protein
VRYGGSYLPASAHRTPRDFGGAAQREPVARDTAQVDVATFAIGRSDFLDVR